MAAKEPEVKAEDVEAQPLTRSLDSARSLIKGSYTWVSVKEEDVAMSHRSRTGIMRSASKGQEKTHRECCGKISDEQLAEMDTMTYDIAELSSWEAFGMWHGSAWDNPSLWGTVGRTMVVAVVVALIVLVGTPDPSSVRSDKFAKLSTFLSVFVGLLLSFFMSSSMNRWYTCVNAFMELFDSVRNLQMQCHALGVDRERESVLTRYGVLSCWLLHLQLRTQMKCSGRTEKEARAEMWNEIETNHHALVTEEEKDMLKRSHEPCQVIWTWVASLVGRMANDGDIPPMASPTYGRILNIVQSAHGGIRTVRSMVCIQAPFIYIHTLAVLVHFNNLINAVSFGMTAGVTIAKFLIDNEMSNKREDRMIAKEAQSIIIAFFISMVGPFLYQALLEVSVCIAQPFSNDDAMIPTVRLLKSLERDLCECDALSRNPPHWREPSFKPPAQAPAASAPPASASPAPAK